MGNSDTLWNCELHWSFESKMSNKVLLYTFTHNSLYLSRYVPHRTTPATCNAYTVLSIYKPHNVKITCNYLLTYLLTPWCRVLLEKLIGLQLVKNFPAFYGTRRFITALTSLRHPSLSWASPIQSIYPHPTSWRSILILSTHPRLISSPFVFCVMPPLETVALTKRKANQ